MMLLLLLLLLLLLTQPITHKGGKSVCTTGNSVSTTFLLSSLASCSPPWPRLGNGSGAEQQCGKMAKNSLDFSGDFFEGGDVNAVTVNRVVKTC